MQVCEPPVGVDESDEHEGDERARQGGQGYLGRCFDRPARAAVVV